MTHSTIEIHMTQGTIEIHMTQRTIEIHMTQDTIESHMVTHSTIERDSHDDCGTDFPQWGDPL